MQILSYKGNFIFNGQNYTFVSPKIFTLSDLIEYFGYKKNLVVLEYNGEICQNENWSLIQLKSNDQIELVTIVGGG